MDLSYIGYVVVEDNSYTWDFSAQNDYTFDSNISFNSGEIKLKETTKNLTDKVSSMSNGNVQVNKNKVFNMVFSTSLSNGDSISFYAKKSGQDATISLCDENVQCSGSNYGSIQIINQANFDWYTITLINLESPKNKFNLYTDKTFKLDYINSSYNETVTSIETNASFAENGSIETNNLEVSNLAYWELFSSEETLNSQQINHYYSTDSGNSWNLIQNTNLSDAPTDSGKIKFKSELISDTESTPVLNKLSLTYKTNVACVENWTANYNVCIDNQKLLYYTDQNSCGTYDNLPSNNGTYLTCVFYKTVENNDLNTTVTMATTANITTVLNIYEESNESLILQDKTKLKKLEFEPSQEIMDNLVWAEIKVYYLESELENIDEESLKMYYYNETSAGWEQINYFLNKDENFISINITHFSTYGIFGDEKQSSQSSGNSGGSSGSSGGSGGISSSKKLTINQECKENWICDEWSSCEEGIQTRTCNDENKCNKIITRPATKQFCETTETKDVEVSENVSEKIKENKKKAKSETITGRVIDLLQGEDSEKVLSLLSILIIFSVSYYIYKKSSGNNKKIYRRGKIK